MRSTLMMKRVEMTNIDTPLYNLTYVCRYNFNIVVIYRFCNSLSFKWIIRFVFTNFFFFSNLRFVAELNLILDNRRTGCGSTEYVYNTLHMGFEYSRFNLNHFPHQHRRRC
jgi:hypothetical protein